LCKPTIKYHTIKVRVLKKSQNNSSRKIKDFLVPASTVIVELIKPAIIKRLTIEKRGQGSGEYYSPFLQLEMILAKVEFTDDLH
jgi:hypothetical protein